MKEKIEKKTTVPMKMRLGYGVGAIGLDMSYGLCMSFFTNYVTDILLLSAGYIGVVMAFARIWDGINDPMMGMIVSNTRTKKFGRFRPWILMGAIANALVLFLMFTNPGFRISAESPSTGLYVYVAVMYVLWGMSYTLIDIPYWSFVPALTNDPEERNVITSFPRFFSGVGQLVVMGAANLLLSSFPVEKAGKVYSSTALMIGLMFVMFAFVTFGTTREKIIPKDSSSYGFKDIFRVIKENDQIPVFLAVSITYNLGWYLVNGLARYFFIYVVENEVMMTVFSAVSGVGQAIGLFGLSFLSKRIGKYNTVKLAIVVSIIGYLLMFAVSSAQQVNIVLFFICDFICCLGIGCMFTAEASMLADIVDYGEFKTGRRSDAITFSMKSFQMKAAQTIQALIIGVGLELSHYQANVIPQPASGKTGISVMMFLIPPVVAAISYIIFTKKYKLKPSFMEEVTQAVSAE